MHRRPVSAGAGRFIIDDTLTQHKQGAIEGLAYLQDHPLNRYDWAHDVVTAHYVNCQDQFPVDLRLYQQFRVKYEAQRLRQLAEQVTSAPILAGYQQLLVELLSYRWTGRDQFQSTGQRCQSVLDELLGYLVHWIVRQHQGGQSPDLILQRLLA